MNSALKPVGMTTSPISQPLNKSLHSQNAPATYGQPMSHVPQNLVNVPHNTTTPANAHSNSLHAPNHYSGNIPNASQQFVIGASNAPPPSNHPVANVSQLTTAKNIAHNSNNIAHSYKMSAPSSENSSDATSAVAESSLSEKSQSNGTSEPKPTSQPESPKNHQAEPSIKDKPPPTPQLAVPEGPTISTEKPNETITSITKPEKPVETSITAIPVEEKQKITDEATSEDVSPVISVKPNLSESANPVPVLSEPIVESSPSVESSIAAPVTNIGAASDPPVQTVETPATTITPHLPDATDSSHVNQESAANVIPSIANKTKGQASPKPTLKLATTPRSPVRKVKPPIVETVEQPKASKSEPKTPNQKSSGLVAKSKRTRTRTQPYQSPLPEVELISKISASASTSRTKNIEDKLIVFYKNEFLAVRNSEGGFYLCQALHNIYKSTRKIRILWLSQDKTDGDVYTPDFYDHTDFDCILTNINLARLAKGKFKLPDKERIRTDSILKRALAVEKGDATPPCPTEEHPDGLDLSLYKEESQLKKRKPKKRRASPLKPPKTLDAGHTPDQAKIRKVEPKPKLPPVKKSLVIKKALAVKAKETTLVNRVFKPTIEAPSTSSIIEQKKAKLLAKVSKKLVPPVLPPQLPSSSTNKPQPPPPPPRTKSTDTVVPFLKKDPPVLKKEVPSVKKELLVLKKESALKKEVFLKKEIPPKKSIEVVRKEAPLPPPPVRKEMPVLKKEVPIVRKEIVAAQKPIKTRKSNRGKK